MFEAIKNFFKPPLKIDYAKLVKAGAIIVDVRTANEYQSGHIDGSINIPIVDLSNNPGKLKDKKKVVIACCASGMRSARAKTILRSRGFLSVYDGGAWNNLQKKL